MKTFGYRGKICLRSPDGTQVIKLHAPGRGRETWLIEPSPDPYGGSLRLHSDSFNNEGATRTQVRHARLRRLLSRGWIVIDSVSEELSSSSKPDDKKKKSGKGKKSDGKEGGSQKPKKGHGDRKKDPSGGKKKENSPKGKGKEKTQGGKKSPSPKDEEGNGKKGESPARKRGNRGGRGRNKKSGPGGSDSQKRRKAIKASLSKQRARHGVYSPQPIQATREMMRSAEKSALVLAELVGRSVEKTTAGVAVDAYALLLALELGDNPLPPLERPRSRPRAKVLITPDLSGSTQDWSGVSDAWALHLSNMPDIDVSCIENFNGSLVVGEFPKDLYSEEYISEVETLLGEYDLVVYLGDGDGKELCRRYAESGATVVAFDCYCANSEKPRAAERFETRAGGSYCWVDRVSSKEPKTWYEALLLAMRGR